MKQDPMSKNRRIAWRLLALAAATTFIAPAQAREPRARDLGFEFPGLPGPRNAITDVAGVEVGHQTIIRDVPPTAGHEGAAIRTGVTAVLPRGKTSTTPVFAAWNSVNAAGEMTGTIWLEERGYLDGPILITNTHSVGIVRDAAVEWMVGRGWPSSWNTPVVAETYDGHLNDINGFHVKREDALQALETAASGDVTEGNVGGGTGMICNRFKGGIGTSSRKVKTDVGVFTVGVLVQCNYGRRKALRISNIPVGAELEKRYLPCYTKPPAQPRCDTQTGDARQEAHIADGSIIVVVATDAPMLPHQLKRLAKRPALALGRLGSVADDGSGDIFIAFSNANTALTSVQPDKLIEVTAFPNDNLTPLFEGVVDATEEAIVNAMVAARTMTGQKGARVYGLPHGEVKRMTKEYRQMVK